jgi:hypothetical protein
VMDLDEYMKLDYPYETTTDEEGATVRSQRSRLLIILLHRH